MGFVGCTQRDEWGLKSNPCSVCYYGEPSPGLYQPPGKVHGDITWPSGMKVQSL